jgi:hypothetical protein
MIILNIVSYSFVHLRNSACDYLFQEFSWLDEYKTRASKIVANKRFILLTYFIHHIIFHLILIGIDIVTAFHLARLTYFLF